jgi:hypothetical protein
MLQSACLAVTMGKCSHHMLTEAVFPQSAPCRNGRGPFNTSCQQQVVLHCRVTSCCPAVSNIPTVVQHTACHIQVEVEFNQQARTAVLMLAGDTHFQARAAAHGGTSKQQHSASLPNAADVSKNILAQLHRQSAQIHHVPTPGVIRVTPSPS